MTNFTFDTLLEPLKNDDFQYQLAKQAENLIFSEKSHAENTAGIIGKFLTGYLNKDKDQTLQSWLVESFSTYSDVWQNAQEKNETAESIIRVVENVVATKMELDTHLQSGKSLANFLSKQIKNIAEKNNLNAVDLAKNVNSELIQANRQFTEFYIGGELPSELKIEPEIPSTLDNLLDVARSIEKSTEFNTNLDLSWWSTKSLCSELWNNVVEETNTEIKEQLKQIMSSSINSIENKGIKVALSAGMIIAEKKGWLSGIFERAESENTIEQSNHLASVIDLTLNVSNGWNDVRLLDNVESGLYKVTDIVAEKTQFMAAKMITAVSYTAENYCGKFGEQAGQKLGLMIGGLINPAAAIIGGMVGACVGKIVGQKVGRAVITPIVETAKKVSKRAISYVKDVVKQGISKTKELGAKIWKKMKSIFS